MGIAHNFIPTGPDTNNNAIISVSEWTDFLELRGGFTGQTIVYDNTKPEGLRLSDSTSVSKATQVISTSTASPIQAAKLVTYPRSKSVVLACANIHGYTSSGGNAAQIDLFINGGVRGTGFIISGEVRTVTIFAVYNFAPFPVTPYVITTYLNITALSSILTATVNVNIMSFGY